MDKDMNKQRRNFLKIMLVGGGALVAGKFAVPAISKFLNGPSVVTDFTSFRTVENKKGLTIFDKKTGEEIFVIDQDGK